MLLNNDTAKLIGLQGIVVKNIEQEHETTEIHIEMELVSHRCPCCGIPTRRVHDYRLQTIKDIPSFGKTVLLILRKRRYVCTSCNKRFNERARFYHVIIK